MNLYIVIDMQNDFVTGSLGSPEAQEAAKHMVGYLRTIDFKDPKNRILFTKDTHGEDYLNTTEGKKLPVSHCIKGTEGWEIIPELKEWEDHVGAVCFEKGTFGSIDLAGYIREQVGNENDTITFLGVCTDICVVSNALLVKANNPETDIRVKADCCAGTTAGKHKEALSVMESCHLTII